MDSFSQQSDPLQNDRKRALSQDNNAKTQKSDNNKARIEDDYELII